METLSLHVIHFNFVMIYVMHIVWDMKLEMSLNTNHGILSNAKKKSSRFHNQFI